MRKTAALILIPVLAAALAGCGQRASLAVKQGERLPPAPYGRGVQPKPMELLSPPTLAIPERSVELRTRSEAREDDPYDLPPPE